MDNPLLTKEEKEIARTKAVEKYQKVVPSRLQNDWDRFDVILAYSLKAQLSKLLKAGYISPEECKQCQQRQLESEKMLNREAAYDEQQLREEVQDWKDRYYEAGRK